MLTISRSGIDLNTLAAQLGNVPKTMIPYAAATALTRCAKHAAQEAIPQEMKAAFNGVTPWTLNSLRFEKATKDKLSARVAVKNVVPKGSVSPENFINPQVHGVSRKRKRSENAMGYLGILASGQLAMPGKGLELDANGNVGGGQVRTILQAVKHIQGKKIKGKRSKNVLAMSESLFVGTPRGRKISGIWSREGTGNTKTLKALFIFTPSKPKYAPRLDFEAAMQRISEKVFRPEFEKAVAELQARGWK